MKIIKQLWWFLGLEKKRYVMGIVSFVLGKCIELASKFPYHGRIIDQIAGNRLSGNPTSDWGSIGLVLLQSVCMCIALYLRMNILAILSRLWQNYAC